MSALRSFGLSPAFSAEAAAVAAIGGGLLGTAVIFKTGLTGKVLGVSGSTKGLFMAPTAGRVCFVLGLTVAGHVMALAYGGFEPLPPRSSSQPGWLRLRLAAGGVLVGLGTMLANGCTSGHGLTGLARLSRRSWTAVPTFMAAGMATATALGSSGALPPDTASESGVPAWPEAAAVAASTVAGLLLAASAAAAVRHLTWAGQSAPAAELISGLAFGCGLVISGMARPSKIAAFLDLGSGAWDPSLAFVMAAALSLTLPFFQLLERRGPKCCVLGAAFELPPPAAGADRSLVVGALLFGAGWGACSACPGPIWVLLAGRPSAESLVLLCSMVLGMAAVELGKRRRAAPSSDLAKPLMSGA